MTRGCNTQGMSGAPDDIQDETNGFTLVELMVVLVIVGLAAAAVVLTLPERRHPRRALGRGHGRARRL
jgi:prepilin-type N-terminal cleavage/methylation domain-containing protein